MFVILFAMYGRPIFDYSKYLGNFVLRAYFCFMFFGTFIYGIFLKVGNYPKID